MRKLFCFSALLFIALPCCPKSVENTAIDRENLEKFDVPAILKDLESGNPDICIKAVNTLAGLARYYHVSNKEDVLPNFKNHLKKELERGHPRSYIVEALKKEIYMRELHRLRNRKKGIVRTFRNLLKSKHKDVRHAAAIGLLCFDPSLQNELAPVLIETIHDGTQPEQISVAVSLCSELRIKEAVPAIIELTKRQKPELIPRKTYIYYDVLRAIGTPEALEFSYWPLWRISGRFVTPLDDYILDRTWPDFLFLSGFIYLFWRSRRASKSGIKISYRPLLITVFVWGLQTIGAIGWTYHIDYPDLVVLFTNMVAKLTYFSPGSLPFALIVGTLAGIIPWLVSFFKLERSERRMLFARSNQ